MRRVALAALVATFAVTGCSNSPTAVVGAPAAPRALAGSYYAGAITLTWELGSGWAGESFRVYGRRVSDADYFLVAEVTSCTGGVCRYTDTNIVENVRYEYYVAAWDARSGLETATAQSVQVLSPARTPPPVPTQLRVIALDGANYIAWGNNARTGDFSFYRVYQAAPDGNDYLLGETDSEGFIDLRAGNGQTYQYFVSSVDVDGHESAGSQLASGTPRPDYAGELLYDYYDRPSLSGFRFQENDGLDPVRHGDDPDAHFSVERDANGFWWLRPGGEAFGANPNGVATTALKCGVAADPTCVDAVLAPQSGYIAGPVAIDPETTYFLRVYGDDGELRYGAIRVVMQGFDQAGDGVVIFDWAYQLQPGNRNLAPSGS